MPTLTIRYANGTEGTLRFVNRYTLHDTAGNIITPPFEQTATLDGASPSVATIDLMSGEDPDITESPWAYIVYENITGRPERVLFAIMPMTDADAVEIFQPDQPDTPELFVLKSEFQEHLDQTSGGFTIPSPEGEADGLVITVSGGVYVLAAPTGGGVSQAYVDAADAALQGQIDVHDGEITDLQTDLAAETARALLAESGLDTRLDAEEAASATFETRLDGHDTDIAALQADDVTVDGRLDAVEASDALKAPINSPTFTGDPKVPTPAGGDNDTSAANTAWVQGELAAYAPKASPTFTGDPKVPTPAAADNDTSIANTAWVQGELASYAPKASPTFTGTVTIPTPTAGDSTTKAASTAFVQGELGAYAPKASPALTGTPTAPTAAQGTNTTQLATTAFVQTASGLLVPKSLFTGKGVVAIATAADTPAAHAAPSTGQFLVGDTSQTDGWINRVLADSDLPTPSMCTISDSAQTVADNTNTVLGTGATESVDTDGYHSNVTNPSRITIPSFGGVNYWFFVVARTAWASNATGYRRINIIKNGAGFQTVYVWAAANGSAMNASMMFPIAPAGGDYFEIQGLQTSGGNLSATLTEFSVYRWKKQ